MHRCVRPERGLIYSTLTALNHKSLIINGAGEENRTLVSVEFYAIDNQLFKDFDFGAIT
jgi:hypothetical protein